MTIAPTPVKAPATKLLALATALALLLATPGPPSLPASAADDVPGATVHAVDAVVGGQILSSKSACIACASLIIGLGGASIIGVVSLLSGIPEFGLACGLACYDWAA